MSGDVQYDGYIRFDVSSLTNHISDSSDIQSAEIYFLAKRRYRGAQAITVEVRKVLKEFNAGTGTSGQQARVGEVDWIDAQHGDSTTSAVVWQRQWQTRNDKEYVVQDTQVIDSTGGLYVWDVTPVVKTAFNAASIVRVKLERARQTASGVWDLHSTEDTDGSVRPYLLVTFT